MSSISKEENIKRFSTGFKDLDDVLGGLPTGELHEVAGFYQQRGVDVDVGALDRRGDAVETVATPHEPYLPNQPAEA